MKHGQQEPAAIMTTLRVRFVRGCSFVNLTNDVACYVATLKSPMSLFLTASAVAFARFDFGVPFFSAIVTLSEVEGCEQSEADFVRIYRTPPALLEEQKENARISSLRLLI